MGPWENNPRGICEDAPCCGCCGPQGDGQYDSDPYEEYDSYIDRMVEAQHEDYDYDEDDE